MALLFSHSSSHPAYSRRYIDPQYQKNTYSDIKPVKKIYRTNITAIWKTYGEHNPKLDKILQDNVERVLRATEIFDPVTDPAATKIHVTVNNSGDKSAAKAKGFGTGASLGLIGNTVSDFYDAKFVVQIGGKEIIKNFKHAIHSVVGRMPPPKGMKAIAPADAGPRLIEDIILNFVREMQDENMFIDVKQPEDTRDKISLVAPNHRRASRDPRPYIPVVSGGDKSVPAVGGGGSRPRA